jgi:hypothetical protein
MEQCIPGLACNKSDRQKLTDAAWLAGYCPVMHLVDAVVCSSATTLPGLQHTLDGNAHRT